MAAKVEHIADFHLDSTNANAVFRRDLGVSTVPDARGNEHGAAALRQFVHGGGQDAQRVAGGKVRLRPGGLCRERPAGRPLPLHSNACGGCAHD